MYFSVFAWEAYEKGADVHLQADPTKLNLLAKEFKHKKEVFKDDVKQNILDKYGGEEHLERPPDQLLMAQSVSLHPHLVGKQVDNLLAFLKWNGSQ